MVVVVVVVMVETVTEVPWYNTLQTSSSPEINMYVVPSSGRAVYFILLCQNATSQIS
jgi:hypothetical protein